MNYYKESVQDSYSFCIDEKLYKMTVKNNNEVNGKDCKEASPYP